MRSSIIAFQLSFLLSTSAHPSNLSPFAPASDQIYSNTTYYHPHSLPDDSNSFELRRRQYCQANYNACANVGAPLACCSADAICSLDNVGQIACCPIGSFCTGTVAIPTALAPTTTNLLTSTANGQLITVTVTSTAPAVVATASTIAPAVTASYVQNPYFPYPYIATSFQNSAACASAYSSCATNFAICTADLAGGSGYAVTISAPGGGVTISPTAATSLPPASAAMVCSSLSSQACPGTSGTCTVFGTAATTGIITSGSPSDIFGAFSWRLWIGGVIGVIVGVLEEVL